MSEKVKVLLISGWGRSGSTILGNILGHINGYFFGGEIRNLWNRVLIENRICGEGIPIKDSELWKSIFQDAFGGFEEVNPLEMRKELLSYSRNRHIPLMFMPGAREKFKSNLKDYLCNTEKLYKSIKSKTNSKIIVDSSKSTVYSFLLSLIDDFDVYVVHLVRDPRGVAYSRNKVKKHQQGDDEIEMERFNPVVSSILWNVRNIATEFLWKQSKDHYMVLRYEDFVSNSKSTVDKISSFVGEEIIQSPFVSENEVKLEMNHAVWGNPSRFNTGVVKLKLDEEWSTKLPKLDKALSTFVTYPLLKKYGY